MFAKIFVIILFLLLSSNCNMALITWCNLISLLNFEESSCNMVLIAQCVYWGFHKPMKKNVLSLFSGTG